MEHKHSGPSDIDSVKTEDFENQFHTLMVKQVAKVPVRSFDQVMVDSDLDTVRSQLVHEKFQMALSKFEIGWPIHTFSYKIDREIAKCWTFGQAVAQTEICRIKKRK